MASTNGNFPLVTHLLNEYIWHLNVDHHLIFILISFTDKISEICKRRSATKVTKEFDIGSKNVYKLLSTNDTVLLFAQRNREQLELNGGRRSEYSAHATFYVKMLNLTDKVALVRFEGTYLQNGNVDKHTTTGLYIHEGYSIFFISKLYIDTGRKLQKGDLYFYISVESWMGGFLFIRPTVCVCTHACMCLSVSMCLSVK